MGNMVAISNIVPVISILDLENQEGFVLKRTVIPLIVYGLVAGVLGLILT
jgi:lactate permease